MGALKLVSACTMEHLADYLHQRLINQHHSDSRSYKQVFAITQMTFGGDKVTMLTHSYPDKSLRKIKLASIIAKLTVHFASGQVSDLVYQEWKG